MNSAKESKTAFDAKIKGFKGFYYAIGIFIFALILYYPSLGGEWLLDDDIGVYKNNLVTSSDSLSRIWFSFDDHDYWPLTRSVFWLEYRFFGNEPHLFRVVNLLLHASVCVLLMLLGRRMGIPGTEWAALLFLVHPVNVSTVAWVSELKNILMTAGLIITAYFFDRFSRLSDKRSYYLSVFFYFLALSGKTAGVFFPFILIILQWRNQGKLVAKDFRYIMPFFILSAIMGSLTMFAQYRYDIFTEDMIEGFSRVALCGWTFFFYLYKTILPYDLSMIYPNWRCYIESAGMLAYLPVILLVGLFSAAVINRNKKWGRFLILTVFPFAFLILPVLGLFKISALEHYQVADFYFYPAIWPLCIVAGCWIHSRISVGSIVGRIFTMLAVSICILLCAAMTWQRSSIYRSSIELWTNVISLEPNSEVAQRLYADSVRNQLIDLKIHISRLENGQSPLSDSYLPVGQNGSSRYEQLRLLRIRETELFKKTVEAYECALKINPLYVEGFNNFGVFLLACGKLEEAKAVMLRTVNAIDQLEDPLHFSRVYYYFGKGALNNHDWELAENYFLKASEDPDAAMPSFRLMIDYVLKQRAFNKVLEISVLFSDRYKDAGEVSNVLVEILEQNNMSADMSAWLQDYIRKDTIKNREAGIELIEIINSRSSQMK